MSKVIVHYINQFFAGKGGEDMADYEPEVVDGKLGPGLGLQGAIGDAGTIEKTIICGDNYFNEHEEEALAFVKKVLKDAKADLLIAGPGFNAGRYGMACGNAAKAASELGIQAISGLYEENPGYDVFKQFMFTVKTKNSAVGMRDAVPAMGKLAKKLLTGEALGTLEEEGLMARGVRQNYFAEERGAKRAVDMLIKKIRGEEFVTEYPMPIFDRVDPHPAVKNMKEATIALVTSGGVVPAGNPDHIEASNASKYGEYSIDNMAETAHGGYDPTYCNENPNRVLPVDVLKDMEKEGVIGKLYGKYYTTVGNGTAVKSSEKFAQEFVQTLVKDGVDAVILTSTWGTCTRCGATLVKEIEKFLPVVHIATVVPISKTVGANRIVPAVAIPFPLGNPKMEADDEKILRRRLVEKAVEALETEVTEQTVFQAKF